MSTPLSSNSVYQEQLERGFGALRFTGELEAEYRADYRRSTLKQLRVVLFLGVLFGFAIAGLDFFLDGPGFSSPAVLQRLIINQTFVVGMFLATFFDLGRRWLTPLGVLVGLNIGGTSLFLGTVAQFQGVGSAFTGYLVVTFYIYLFLGLPFRPALYTACSLFVAWVVMAMVNGLPPAAIAYNGLFLGFTNLIGATGLYNLEYSQRLGFLEARQLNHLATRDALTGLANRSAFDAGLAAAWQSCGRARSPLTLALVDIDHFKAFNDNHGHQAGDECLVQVAAVLGRCAKRATDLVARYGGEEFVVLLPNCSAEDGEQILARARAEVEALGLRNQGLGEHGQVTVSAGLATVRPQETERSPAGLLQLADEALYQAKEMGRNTVVVAGWEQDVGRRTGMFIRPTGKAS